MSVLLVSLFLFDTYGYFKSVFLLIKSKMTVKKKSAVFRQQQPPTSHVYHVS
jgi:hypothetical protein